MSFLDEPLTTIAVCWRIERRDGVTIGLTDHDRDLIIDGVVHRAAPGMTPSAITRSEGLQPDTMDVTGVLSSSAIAADDLLAGRWDGAVCALFAVDWTGSATRIGSAARIALGEGTIGAVETRGDDFTAELRGATGALDRQVGEETSPECRAELGDRRCRVAMAGRRRFAHVLSVVDRVVTLDMVEAAPNAFGDGMLRWFGGRNSGLSSAITGSDGARVTLRSVPPFAAEAGDGVELSEGCDKSLATCAARFANAVNFRGEPHLPGIDLLTRYPGG